MTEMRPVPSCPPDVLGWLPWYGDDSLSDERRGAVEAHAAECGACRAEIEVLMGGEIDPAAPAAPAGDAMYARVLARIDRSAADEATSGMSRSATPPRVAPRRPTATRLQLVGSIAAALLIGFALGGVRLAPETVYETVTERSAGAAGAEIDVVFHAHATVEEITEAVRSIGGTVVDGPSSSLGVYRVRLGSGADAVGAAALLRGDRGVATFAQEVPSSR